mgnify:CR=1 FL=1
MYIDEEFTFPLDSRDLITLLDTVFPPRCIKVGETEIQAHRYAAIRDLIDELVALKIEYEEGEDVNPMDDN